MVDRIDHFASQRATEEKPPVADPGLEYERYRITPGLISSLKSLTISPYYSGANSLGAGMDDLIRSHAKLAYRAGQDDIIAMLAKLMATQANQEST